MVVIRRQPSLASREFCEHAVWRRFLIALALFVACIVAFTHVLRSERVAQVVRDRLQTWASAQMHQPVTIGALTIELVPPALVLEQVIVTPCATGAYALQLQHARVQPRPWPSSAGALVLAGLEIQGLIASLPVDLSLLVEAVTPHGASRPDALGHGPARSRPLPLDIQRLNISDATLTLTQGDNWVTAAGITVLMHPAAVSGRHVTLDVLQIAAYLPNLLQAKSPHVLGLHVQGSLVGTLDHPRYLHLQALQAHTIGVTAQVRGDIDFVSQPTLQLHASLQAPLASLQALAGRPLGWEGYVDVAGAVTGALHDLAWQGEAAGTNLAMDDRHIGEAQAEFRWHDGALAIPGATWQMVDGGKITGSAEWDIHQSRALQASARLHAVAVPEFLAVMGIPHAWIRQTLQGDVHAAGTTHPWDMRLNVDLASENFAALDNAYDLPRTQAVLSIPAGHVMGSAHFGALGVTLHQMAISSGRGRIFVDGLLPYNINTPMSIQAQTHELLDLRLLGPIAQVPFFGLAQLDVSITGLYENPVIDAHTHVEGFGLFDYTIGKTQAHLQFANLTLHMDALRADVGGGTIDGAGALHFDAPEVVPVELALVANNIDAKAILTALHVSENFANHIQAQVGGRVLLSGPVQRPMGVAHLVTDQLRVDRVALGPANLESSFGNRDTHWEGSLVTHPPQGDLRLRGAYRTDDTVALGGEAARLPMALVGTWIGNFTQTGTLQAQWDVHGPVNNLSGGAQARVDDYTVGTVQLGSLVIDATIHDSLLKGRGHVGGRAVVWNGSLELRNPLNYTLHTVFTEARVQEFWQLPADVTLTATGMLDLSGSLVGTQWVRGTAHVFDVHGTWRHASLRNDVPFELSLEQDIVNINHGAPVTLKGPNLQVQVRGRVMGQGPDMKLAVHGDVGLLTGLFPSVSMARGPFVLQVGVHGPWQQLALAGEGNVQQVSLHVGQSDQGIEKLRAHLVFVGRGLEVSRGSAQVGDGHITFGGDTVWPGDNTPPRFNLQTNLHRIHLRPLDNLESTMSGDLQLQGPLNDLQLKGKLKLDALRYTARLDLDRLIPKRNAQPLRVSTLSQVPPVHLAVKVQGSNNIIISSSVLEAELQADLTLTGTSDRLGVLGNVAPLWARARYRDNTFKVNRATVDFVDEYRVVVEFNVQAETRACNLVADVTVQGNSDGYTVTAQGQDEHGGVDPQDVLSCLQFGLRLHDFAGNQRAPAGVSDALPGSLDALWTVSGMDDKVKKLLPIDVDELRLTSGWSSLSQRTTARVLVGKELGNGVALKYSRSIDEYADQSLSIEYRLTQRTTLLGTWVSVRDVPVGDFGVDLRLRWEKP